MGLDLTASKVDCLRDHTTYFPPCPPALAVRHSPRITIELKPKVSTKAALHREAGLALDSSVGMRGVC